MVIVVNKLSNSVTQSSFLPRRVDWIGESDRQSVGMGGATSPAFDVGLCRRVHRQVRAKAPQRKCAFSYLARFWTAAILRAPISLTHALEDARLGKEGLFPRVRASSEAFFEKCRDMSWKFFLALYQGFTESIWEEAPKVYARSLGKVWERFPAIVAVHGSKCDAIRKRLKLLWNEKGVVLPGCMTAFYDLAREVTRPVLFSSDAAQHRPISRRFWANIETLSAASGGFIPRGDDGSRWLMLKVSKTSENYLSGKVSK